MIKTITSMTQLNAQMNKVCKQVCDKATNIVKELIDDFIMAYYVEYTPQQYDRTYSFLDSCIRTKVQPINGGYQAMVYIDTWDLDYSDNGLEIIRIINSGYHGIVSDKYRSKYKFWDDSMEKLNNGEFSKCIGELLKGIGLTVTYI
jgi:hypothetical protein